MMVRLFTAAKLTKSTDLSRLHPRISYDSPNTPWLLEVKLDTILLKCIT